MRIIYCILFSLLCFQLNLTAQITPVEAALLMQKGINLGNTLEPPLEGGWNNPAVQEYYFDLYKQAGFNTVRIPVRWDQHTQTTSPYTISESWLNRVEQIVDWALERDLFVVINAHHDDWIKNNYSNPAMRDRFDSIWSQISVRFKNKPEKLLFEILNEPYGLTKVQNDDMHARILGIIRKTNPTRIVIFQGHNWGGSDELLTAAIPEDSYLMGSFHSYDPYLFGLEGKGFWGTASDYAALENKFIAVKNWSTTHNIPVFLGEFGSLRSCDYNSRMKHYRAYVELSQKYGFVSCAWDDGGNFRILNRQEKTWEETKDILINTNAKAPNGIKLKIIQDSLIRITWNNVVHPDSICIEHRTPSENFKRLVTVSKDSSGYTHTEVSDNIFHHYRIIACLDSGFLYSQPMRIFVPEIIPKVRSYYGSQPFSIPGTIQAEEFDYGGEGLTYHDVTDNNTFGQFRPQEAVDIYKADEETFIVGNIWPGEWLEYTVDVTSGGKYRVDFHIAAYQKGGLFNLLVGKILSPDLIAESSNSMVNTTLVTDTMELEAGIQIMRFTVIDDHPTFNIDKIVFTAVEVVTATDDQNLNESPITVHSARNLKISWRSDLTVNRLDFYTIHGKLISSINQPENNLLISNDFPKGIYILKASTYYRTYSTKFIIQ